MFDVKILIAQLDGWRRLMDPTSRDYDPTFTPDLNAIQAALAVLERAKE